MAAGGQAKAEEHSGPIRTAKRRRGEVPLSDQAYEMIEEKIVTNEFPPNKVLSEAYLANLLGTGRTPVREALQRLAAEGLVQVLPQRGILVSDLTVDNYLRLMEARLPLEILLAELASMRASEAQRKRILEISTEFRRTQHTADERMFMKLDREFNALLSAAAGNPYVSRMVGLLQGQSRRFYFKHHAMADLGEVARLHAELAEAVAAGAQEKAKPAAADIIEFNTRLASRVLLDKR